MSEAKLALVTGASAGIGLEIARGLWEAGFQVVLAVRSRERGEATARDIAGPSLSRLPEILLVDFSSQASIRVFAKEFLDRHQALDVLVNNAGTWSVSRRESVDGVELVWATNQLGYFLTTELVRPALLAAPSARVVVVASELAGDLDLNDLSFARRFYTGAASYAQTKQANRMWTRALARRFSGTNVTVNSMHPGGVATGLLGKGGGLVTKALGSAISMMGRTPKEGADTAVWLATAPEFSLKTGGFYFDRNERVCRFANEAEEERLFAVCASMTGT